MINNKQIIKTIITNALLLIIILISGCITKEFIKSEIRPGNEEIYLQTDSNKAVLLIHGFTASPWEVKDIAQFLYKNNITVYAPLLAGHGEEDYRALSAVDYEDWINEAFDAYSILKNKNEKVYVLGVSMGANLALDIAKEEDTTGVIAINAPIILKDKLIYTSPILKYFIPYSTNKKITKEEEPYYYKKRSVKAIAEFVSYNKQFRKDLEKVTEPVLIIQSKNDYRVEPKSAEILNKSISSSWKKVIWIDSESHVLLKSENNDEVFREILMFIESK